MVRTKRKNTFGKYKFPKWIPIETRKLIKDFWGQMGRNYKEWLESCVEQDQAEFCSHGPNPNGFRMPPLGARAIYFVRDYDENEKSFYKQIEGRYVHRWNNMGSLIDDKGVAHCVSTCDCWVRVFRDNKEREKLLKKELNS